MIDGILHHYAKKKNICSSIVYGYMFNHTTYNGVVILDNEKVLISKDDLSQLLLIVGDWEGPPKRIKQQYHRYVDQNIHPKLPNQELIIERKLKLQMMFNDDLATTYEYSDPALHDVINITLNLPIGQD
jgi:hypothetical protein